MHEKQLVLQKVPRKWMQVKPLILFFSTNSPDPWQETEKTEQEINCYTLSRSQMTVKYTRLKLEINDKQRTTELLKQKEWSPANPTSHPKLCFFLLFKEDTAKPSPFVI